MNVLEKNKGSWAESLPKAQGLYDPQLEKDACGVGFIIDIKGRPSRNIIDCAKQSLCNMTHRGAVGSNDNDGDGAGIMTSIPDELYRKEFPDLPQPGEYATGNIYFHPEETTRNECIRKFEEIANSLKLNIQHWRKVPRNHDIIGPVSRTKEPMILQPIIYKPSEQTEKEFKKKLYYLRKIATHQIGIQTWFYICSLSNKTMVYKGLLTSNQVFEYFLDLTCDSYQSYFVMVHSRFSTNTFPSWERAQPMRWSAHNGEINTLKGNKNWMRAREGVMKSTELGEELDNLYPIIETSGSDSAAFDNVLELLIESGSVSLPEAVMMMIPEAWQNDPLMDPHKKAFYQWAACLMEPWDGPALFTFSDGRYCGASLDRNGLRPCRYYITSDDLMVCASEVGTLEIEPEKVVKKGRLQPGKMLLVDTTEGRLVVDSELKSWVSKRHDYHGWVDLRFNLSDITPPSEPLQLDPTPVAEDPLLKAFGFTFEQMNLLLLPMIKTGKESLGSMGNDTPLACLSHHPRSIYDFFKQLFAQVTNPPIDPIRESIVMSLECAVGPQENILQCGPSQCRRLILSSPILSLEEMSSIRNIQTYDPTWKVSFIDITFPKDQGHSGYRQCLNSILDNVLQVIEEGAKVLVLTDTKTSASRVPVSMLLASGAVHHFLVEKKLRSKIAIVVETGEAREVHHMCVLLGYGVDAICPYLVLQSIHKLTREKVLVEDPEKLCKNYIKATEFGILKVMSKMGISTLQSYKGAQIFEALGIDSTVVDFSFAGTPSRIGGATFETFSHTAFQFHQLAFPLSPLPFPPGLPEAGEYHWRDGGETHINEPNSIASLQDAVRRNNLQSYQNYCNSVQQSIQKSTIRGLLDFDFEKCSPIDIDQVEPWTNIVARFCTGAMSYGSLSKEAHSTLAIAMNRLGGKSNSGEGGEDFERSIVMENGDSRRSAIKQVASGRFGVNSFYLSEANELQIKMAQGAKPGEGGELPGHKVSQEIAKTRKSTAGVGLISPPPHHDIYSIEDLKQLIYDLKSSNPSARVSVKLVSEIGVGIVAAGVTKAKADHILISGHDGGTGASRWTGIRHAGLPWELGLAETHQTLVLNDLRGRIVLQTDGQIKTGRDVAIACLLGAEEWGFGTTPLIALGCTMMRKCHLNTCPVGVATQDPELRKKFNGAPEHVINFFYYVAEEVRMIMAKLGIKTINEMVGRCDLLKARDSINQLPNHSKISLDRVLVPAFLMRPDVSTFHQEKQNHRLSNRLDHELIQKCKSAIEKQEKIFLEQDIYNINRAVGSTLSYHLSRKYLEAGLPDDTIHIKFNGSAGQSFGAFLASGITLELEGDSNDYVGKGLSGGKIIIYPPKTSKFSSENNVIIGNVCFYGATSGKAFIRGIAAERFCVRNSGVSAVIEGVGDHGCEYMTGGRVVILGRIGKNFGAGMSGGIAYLYDPNKKVQNLCNHEMILLEQIESLEEVLFVKGLIEEHRQSTGSSIAGKILEDFDMNLKDFVKVIPTEYKKVLEEQKFLEIQKKVLPSNVDIHGKSGDHEKDGQIEVNGLVNSVLAQSQDPKLDNSPVNGSVPLIEPNGLESNHQPNGVSSSLKIPSHNGQILPNQTNGLSHNLDNTSNVEHTNTISSAQTNGLSNGISSQSPNSSPVNGKNGVSDIEDISLDEKEINQRIEKLDRLNGFRKYQREIDVYRDPKKRTKDWKEINQRLPKSRLRIQAARCMDCGIPFCQSDHGCPIGNIIPKWNELVAEDRWKEAYDRLMMTNNFPEFTGRVCPAPCEGACVLGINELPVSIKSIECAIIDHAFKQGWVTPSPPLHRTGKSVAIIGSGPAGLAAADQLNKAGHFVTVYEREDRFGGLLMYGIPNMKLDKTIVQRRIDLLRAEGIAFIPKTHIGVDVSAQDLLTTKDAVLVATGATWPRDLPLPNRNANGIHFAMEFLQANTKNLLDSSESINAKGKHVIVIGGGDTGCDCIGTSIRQGAASITNFELLPQPPQTRAPDNPWPLYPKVFRVDYGHAEVISHYGKDPREYCILTKSFITDESSNIKAVETVRIDWVKDENGKWKFSEIPDSKQTFRADLILLAMGFLGPERELIDQLGLEVSPKSSIQTKPSSYNTTTHAKVFSAGDCRRGQSLIVWAIQEGRQAAKEIDTYLSNRQVLPGPGGIMF